MEKFTNINKYNKKSKMVEKKPVQKSNVVDSNLLYERSPVVDFFSKLFESREMAHIYHLQVNGELGSYASHVALNEYYDKVITLLDELIEVYQGQYGLIYGYKIILKDNKMICDKIEYFENLAEYVRSNRHCINDNDTHLHNIIDEIMSLIYKTLYKLKYNK